MVTPRARRAIHVVQASGAVHDRASIRSDFPRVVRADAGVVVRPNGRRAAHRQVRVARAAVLCRRGLARSALGLHWCGARRWREQRIDRAPVLRVGQSAADRRAGGAVLQQEFRRRVRRHGTGGAGGRATVVARAADPSGRRAVPFSRFVDGFRCRRYFIDISIQSACGRIGFNRNYWGRSVAVARDGKCLAAMGFMARHVGRDDVLGPRAGLVLRRLSRAWRPDRLAGASAVSCAQRSLAVVL